MTNLQSSFNDVADWTKQNLEPQRGQTVGMTFASLLLVYGRLAILPTGQTGTPEELELTARSVVLLAALHAHYLNNNWNAAIAGIVTVFAFIVSQGWNSKP
jgi:hypothetical protein